MAASCSLSPLRWLKAVSSCYILRGHYYHSLSLDATIMVSNKKFKNLKKKLHIHCTLSLLKEMTLNVLELPYADDAKF